METTTANTLGEQPMVTNGKFEYQWGEHGAKLRGIVNHMFYSGSMVDVTVACTDGTVRAHQMILAAFSPYFQSLFTANPCRHPVIFLHNVQLPVVKALVDFIYQGTVTCSIADVPGILDLAKSLQIRGLDHLQHRLANVVSVTSVPQRQQVLQPPPSPSTQSTPALSTVFGLPQLVPQQQVSPRSAAASMGLTMAPQTTLPASTASVVIQPQVPVIPSTSYQGTQQNVQQHTFTQSLQPSTVNKPAVGVFPEQPSLPRSSPASTESCVQIVTASGGSCWSEKTVPVLRPHRGSDQGTVPELFKITSSRTSSPMGGLNLSHPGVPAATAFTNEGDGVPLNLSPKRDNVLSTPSASPPTNKPPDDEAVSVRSSTVPQMPEACAESHHVQQQPVPEPVSRPPPQPVRAEGLKLEDSPPAVVTTEFTKPKPHNASKVRRSPATRKTPKSRESTKSGTSNGQESRRNGEVHDVTSPKRKRGRPKSCSSEVVTFVCLEEEGKSRYNAMYNRKARDLGLQSSWTLLEDRVRRTLRGNSKDRSKGIMEKSRMVLKFRIPENLIKLSEGGTYDYYIPETGARGNIHDPEFSATCRILTLKALVRQTQFALKEEQLNYIKEGNMAAASCYGRRAVTESLHLLATMPRSLPPVLHAPGSRTESESNGSDAGPPVVQEQTLSPDLQVHELHGSSGTNGASKSAPAATPSKRHSSSPDRSQSTSPSPGRPSGSANKRQKVQTSDDVSFISGERETQVI